MAASPGRTDSTGRSSLRIALLCVLVAILAITQAMLTPLPSADADGGSKKDKERERDSVQQQLDDLSEQLEDTNSDLSDTYLALAETELRIPEAQKKLDGAKKDVKDARDQDREVGDRLDKATSEEKDLTDQVENGKKQVSATDEELSQVAISAYKGGGAPSPTSVYMGSSSPQDAVDRSMNYRLTLEAQDATLSDQRTDQSVTENSADRLTAVREEIDDLKDQAEKAVERKEKAEKKAADAKDSLDDLYAKQKKQAKDLKAKKKKYKHEESDLQDRSDTLDDQIAELARKEKEREKREAREAEKRAAASNSGSSDSSGSGSSGSGSSSGSSSSGAFIRPVSGPVGSPFGWRIHPIYHTRKLHAGQDFPVACGTPVKAMADGTATRTWTNGGGHKLIITHGSYNGKVISSSSHHLRSFAVPSGAHVTQGQVVGYVGTTGSSTGCHLHFQVYEDGAVVNPMKYIG
jgi:murein DD-endopeptidase MepM/ murein hydrolase activator NlpD